jgi:hypothetical protein
MERGEIRGLLKDKSFDRRVRALARGQGGTKDTKEDYVRKLSGRSLSFRPQEEIFLRAPAFAQDDSSLAGKFARAAESE